MDMPRSIRAGTIIMNSEMIYAFLMGTGWFFLIGWLVALIVAYAKAFQNDEAGRTMSVSAKGKRLPQTGQSKVLHSFRLF
jgi:hypothetical protein